MRRWRYTSFVTSATTSVGYCSARSRSSVMRAPTTSWWWKLTPPCRERARLRLADVVEQRGEAHDQLGPRVAHDRDRVREHVLVGVDRVLLEPHRVELGQELVGELGLAEEPETRRSDRRPAAASTARRGSARRSRSRGGGAARRSPRRARAPGVTPELRRRSAPRAACAAGRRRTRSRAPAACAARARRGRPRRRTGRRTRARATPSAIAFTVKSRRDRSVSMSSENCDLGLAALGAVDLGAERGDLEVAAGLASRRWCRSRGPGATPRRPSRRTIRSTDVGPGARWRGRCRDPRGRGRGRRRAPCRRRGTPRGPRPRGSSASSRTGEPAS